MFYNHNPRGPSPAKQDFLPYNITTRVVPHSGEESASLAILFDTTGSMGGIPRAFVQGTLVTLIDEIDRRKSIPNPHIMFGAVGDFNDTTPLQFSDFSKGKASVDQLRQLYIQNGGGAYTYLNYYAALLFAARKTQPAGKGMLFIIGDQPCEGSGLTVEEMRDYLGIESNHDMSKLAIVNELKKKYEIFYLSIESQYAYKDVAGGWRELFDDKVIPVKDTDQAMIAQIIVSIIDRYYAGKSQALVAASWEDTNTQNAVATAIANLGTLAIANAPSQETVVKTTSTLVAAATPVLSFFGNMALSLAARAGAAVGGQLMDMSVDAVAHGITALTLTQDPEALRLEDQARNDQLAVVALGDGSQNQHLVLMLDDKGAIAATRPRPGTGNL
jgi:hypothetical protein